MAHRTCTETSVDLLLTFYTFNIAKAENPKHSYMTQNTV